MIRLLAILGLLPLLAVMAAFGLVHRSFQPQPQHQGPVTQMVDPPELSPSITSSPGSQEPASNPQGPMVPGDANPTPTDLEPIPTSPFPEFAFPATPPGIPDAKNEDPPQSLELLELEISLLRDTNRDLLAALEALKNQLIQAQAEIVQLQSMLPLEEIPLPTP